MRIEAARALITDKVRGKKIDFIGVQAECLLIATTDGQTYRIGWRDSTTQELVPGSPSLEGIDTSLMLEPLVCLGVAGL